MSSGLTSRTRAGGCASKLSPSVLAQALRGIPQANDPNVLVGFNTADDAGVYNLTGIAGAPLALVQTVDFFTPIVDDPYTFGAIAAANALSDVYAMGGRPLTALSILVFPARGDIGELTAMLRGGNAKIAEAKCVVLGGHSVAEDEIKFGYAITGLIEPRHIWTNAGAKRGDVLLFSKKLGTGVISSALKSGAARQAHIDEATAQMLTLNQAAAEALAGLAVHACTDVTGFGILGHSREMALASEATLQIETNSLQFLPGALDYSAQLFHSGGLSNNRAFVQSCVVIAGEIAPEIEALLYDPQTSGGLLVALPSADAEIAKERYPAFHRVGRVVESGAKPLEVIR